MHVPSQKLREPILLRPFTKFLVALTLLLIFLGGQVKSHNAGLAVPDWPTTYGVNMFLYHWSNWVGNIFHEHVHRLVAASVGLCCIVLAVWLRLREPRGWVRMLGYLALAAVIAQGVLGGLTVIFLLPDPISVSHAVLAQSFLVLVVLIAYSQSKERARRVESGEAGRAFSLGWPVFTVAALIYVQLILGAVMRHTESGLAIPDFPTMGGRWVPTFDADMLAWINRWRYDQGIVNHDVLEPVVMGQVMIHFAHRLGALAVVAAACYTTVAAFRRRSEYVPVWRAMLMLDAVLICQVLLGVFTVWMLKYPLITSLHVVTGAAALAVASFAVMRAAPITLAAAEAPVATERPVRAGAELRAQ